MRQAATCNRQLVKSTKRIDGRDNNEYRALKIGFGADLGCCVVSLGNTKVMTTVTSAVGEPRITRPAEGLVNIRLDSSLVMLGGPLDNTRNSEENVELSRLLQKNLKDSGCLDLESLCIIGGEKVWHITIDVAIVNHEGNIVEAASIAVLAALCHLRIPQIIIDNSEVVVQPLEYRNSLKLTINHLPFLMRIVFFKDEQHSNVDPLEEEEKFCDGYLIVGGNEYDEVTCLHISGKALISKDQILKQCNQAMRRTKQLNQLVKEALARDEMERDAALLAKTQYVGNLFDALSIQVFN